MTPDLSLLIVNFNGRDMLRDLLRSIEQTRGDLNLQVIVFDNASTDGSAPMTATEFPSVVLEKSNVNVGFARGNNRAARLAAAPLLLLLNNDTVVSPGAMQSLIQCLADHPDVVAVGPQLIGADGNPQRSGRNLPTLPALLNSIQLLKWTGLFRGSYKRYRHEGFDPAQPGQISQLAAAALMIRRESFEHCQGFDEGFEFGVEDVDLCKRLSQTGFIYYLPAARITHLGRVSSRANRAFVYRAYECGWARYLRKHHGPFPSLLYKLLVTLDMPLRLLILTTQCLAQTLTHQPEKASRTTDRLSAAAAFTARSLPHFWRS